ncbi:MAG: DUF1761 domain-containing protein [Hyphomicrobiaceae bacterium]
MKFFAGLNVWALPLAAAASFIFGGIWYGVLSKQWMEAANLTKDEIDTAGGMSARPLIITYVAQVFMAWMLAGVILHMVKAGIPATMQNGMITAGFIWAGFIMTTLIVNHQFQMQKRALTLIDGAYWLGVMLIQGAILGIWGLR